jgi:hypothetical protein
MVCFQAENTNLGKFRIASHWKMFVYFIVIRSIFGNLVYFWQFGLFLAMWSIFGNLIYFMVIWYIFHRFGMLYQEKSGNPVQILMLANFFFLRGLFCRQKTTCSLLSLFKKRLLKHPPFFFGGLEKRISGAIWPT